MSGGRFLVRLREVDNSEKISKIKKLKGKNISITEGLTKKRMEVLKKAREDHGFENLWSSEGRILYKDVTKGDKIKIYFV